MRKKARTVFLGLQILIFNGAGLQILLNPLLFNSLLPTPLQLCWICNPTPSNISICDAEKAWKNVSRIENPNIHGSRIANPAQRALMIANPAQQEISCVGFALCRSCVGFAIQHHRILASVMRKKIRTGILGLQILIFMGAGLQILLNECSKQSCSTEGIFHVPQNFQIKREQSNLFELPSVRKVGETK